jgi:hypothetical protein
MVMEENKIDHTQHNHAQEEYGNGNNELHDGHVHNANEGYDRPFGSRAICWQAPIVSSSSVLSSSTSEQEQGSDGHHDEVDDLDDHGHMRHSARRSLTVDGASAFTAATWLPTVSLGSGKYSEKPRRMDTCSEGWNVQVAAPTLVDAHGHERRSSSHGSITKATLPASYGQPSAKDSSLMVDEVYSFPVTVTIEEEFEMSASSSVLEDHHGHGIEGEEYAGGDRHDVYARLILCDVAESGYCTPYSPEDWMSMSADGQYNNNNQTPAVIQIQGEGAGGDHEDYYHAAHDIFEQEQHHQTSHDDDEGNSSVHIIPIFASPFHYLHPTEETCYATNSTSTSTTTNNTISTVVLCESTYRISIPIRLDRSAMDGREGRHSSKTFIVLGHVATLVPASALTDALTPGDRGHTKSSALVLGETQETGTISHVMVEDGNMTDTNTTTETADSGGANDNANARPFKARLLTKVDMANTLRDGIFSNVVVFQSPPEILSNSLAFKVSAGVVLGIVALIQLGIFGSLVKHSAHKVMQLSQVVVLMTLEVFSIAATVGACVSFIPWNSTTCVLRNFLVFVPLTVTRSLVLALFGRISAVLRPLALMGRSTGARNRNKKSASRTMTHASTNSFSASAVSNSERRTIGDNEKIDDNRTTICGSCPGIFGRTRRDALAQGRRCDSPNYSCNNQEDSSLSFAATTHDINFLTFLSDYERQFQCCLRWRNKNGNMKDLRLRRNGIRQNIKIEQLFWLTFLISLPQLIFQIWAIVDVNAQCQFVVVLNQDQTLGRQECARPSNYQWTTWTEILFFALPCLFIAILARGTQHFPSLFNESEHIKSLSQVVLIALTVGIPLLFLTESATVPPDVTSFLYMTLDLVLILVVDFYLILPKLQIVWSGEKVVISTFLQPDAASSKDDSSFRNNKHQQDSSSALSPSSSSKNFDEKSVESRPIVSVASNANNYGAERTTSTSGDMILAEEGALNVMQLFAEEEEEDMHTMGISSDFEVDDMAVGECSESASFAQEQHQQPLPRSSLLSTVATHITRSPKSGPNRSVSFAESPPKSPDGNHAIQHDPNDGPTRKHSHHEIAGERRKSKFEIRTAESLPSRLLKDMMRLKPALDHVLNTSMAGMQVSKHDLKRLKATGEKFGESCERIVFVDSASEEKEEEGTTGTMDPDTLDDSIASAKLCVANYR